jgi:hypothetical protein
MESAFCLSTRFSFLPAISPQCSSRPSMESAFLVLSTFGGSLIGLWASRQSRRLHFVPWRHCFPVPCVFFVSPKAILRILAQHRVQTSWQEPASLDEWFWFRFWTGFPAIFTRRNASQRKSY